jgi:superfamily I DNA/RNA helicase/DNA polymerase III epsilon subunit-like protein
MGRKLTKPSPEQFEPSADQCLAIEAPVGPILVVAGPGAGKTYCLISRIQHLISCLGFDPARLCAVTFTNKAADEISGRLTREIGPEAEEITRGTLHSLCFSLLRQYGAAIGLRRGFGIADEDYQRRVLSRMRIRSERQAQLLLLFGRHQLQNYQLTAGDQELFNHYQDALRSRHLVDYNDLISLVSGLLRECPAAAAEIRARWDCVLVDEFQDLSLVQYHIVTELAREHRHCFAVGDDEQSIFSWTGADPAVLDRFRTDFEIAAPIVLDRNRRCSRQIFDVARRLITRNPALFHKELVAERDSEHEVAAQAFEDERSEASWLIDDLVRDRAASGLEWGNYALLYRSHRIGQHLEGRLVEAGIPCRMAKGHALLDDEVIGYVASSLHVIRSPEDPLVVEAFAERMLPPTLVHQVRAQCRGMELLPALRAFARGARGHPDARKAWRFVFHVENLAALGRAHQALMPLADELLSQRLGPYRNPLEERAAELTDPMEMPGARALAIRLGTAASGGHTVWVEPDRGVEIALERLIREALGADVRRLTDVAAPRPGDFVVRAGAVRPLVIWKALQSLHCQDLTDPFQDYVAFDVETTDNDVADCEIVELAAVRVRGRVIVDQFQRLVRASRPINPKATAVHGHRDDDLCDQPGFAEVWPAFREFVGGDLLVAHNGQEFDVPIIRRLSAGLPGADDLVFFDSLPLARSLVEESAKLSDLAHRFGVSAGRSHHALDDAGTLVGVLRKLGDLKLARARKAALVHLLGWLGLALALDSPSEPTAEERVLLELALPSVLGRYGDCLEVYAAECAAAGAPSVEEIIERLGGARLMERIRSQRSAAERYPSSVARLNALVAASAAPSLDESIDLLLGRLALSRWDGSSPDDRRVNLLTLHSTKGLEFSRVYVVGAEDAQLPGSRALDEGNEDEIKEARRLLYVGMTRAKDRLVLTSAERRDGRAGGGTLFLREAGLQEA